MLEYILKHNNTWVDVYWDGEFIGWLNKDYGWRFCFKIGWAYLPPELLRELADKTDSLIEEFGVNENGVF